MFIHHHDAFVLVDKGFFIWNLVVGLDGSFKHCQEVMQAKSEKCMRFAPIGHLFLQNSNPNM